MTGDMNYTQGMVDWDAVGMIRATTADPAAGAQLAVVTVPAGKRMKIYSAEATVVCDATVANRYFTLYVRMNGTDNTYITNAGLTITASQTKIQSFKSGSLITTAGTQYGMHFPEMELPAGATLFMFLSNIQAADDIGAMTYTYKVLPA